MALIAPPHPLPALAWIAGSLALGPGLSLSLYVVLREYQRASFRVERGYLVASMGGLGEAAIPLSSVRAVRRIDKAKVLLRVAGVQLPGLYLGLFAVEGLGRVKVMATRLSDLVLVELRDSSKYLLSPEDPEGLAQAATTSMGSGPPGRVRAEGVDAKALALAAALLIAFSSALFYVYGLLPEVVPVHYGLNWVPDRWEAKSELVALQLVFLALGCALLAIFAALHSKMREFLGMSLPIVPVMAGLGCMALAIELMVLYI